MKGHTMPNFDLLKKLVREGILTPTPKVTPKTYLCTVVKGALKVDYKEFDFDAMNEGWQKALLHQKVGYEHKSIDGGSVKIMGIYDRWEKQDILEAS